MNKLFLILIGLIISYLCFPISNTEAKSVTTYRDCKYQTRQVGNPPREVPYVDIFTSIRKQNGCGKDVNVCLGRVYCTKVTTGHMTDVPDRVEENVPATVYCNANPDGVSCPTADQCAESNSVSKYYASIKSINQSNDRRGGTRGAR